MRGLQGSFLGSASGLCAAHEEGAGEKDGSRCRRGDTVMHEAEGDTWPEVRLLADFLALLASCCETPGHLAYAAARAAG